MSLSKIATFAAASLLATTVIAAAQQTDSNNNAMGSNQVGNGRPTTVTPGQSGMTTGSNMGSHGGARLEPQSSQGDAGPGTRDNKTIINGDGTHTR